MKTETTTNACGAAVAEKMACSCCGGDLPPNEIWEANRNDAGECDGSVTADGRCRAFADDSLWDPIENNELARREFCRQVELLDGEPLLYHRLETVEEMQDDGLNVNDAVVELRYRDACHRANRNL